MKPVAESTNVGQVKSKQRVADHGEVFTNPREVNAMLDLVKAETERIESRFLEPACGNGNFLAEVLRRKLAVVADRYRKSPLEYERNAFLATSSIYGIDILEDNVSECRIRLSDIVLSDYRLVHATQPGSRFIRAIEFVLERNIIWGDALSLMTVGQQQEKIVFSEWSPFNGSQIVRRDFTMSGLIPKFLPNPSLFPEPDLFSDLGEEIFIPKPLPPDYPPCHFLDIANAI